MPVKALIRCEEPGQKARSWFAKHGEEIPNSNGDNHSAARVNIYDTHVGLSAEYGGQPYPGLRGTHEFSYGVGKRETFYTGSWLLHELGIRPCTKVTMKVVPDTAELVDGKLTIKS